MRTSMRGLAVLGVATALLVAGCAAQDKPLTPEQEALIAAEAVAAGGAEAPANDAAVPPRKKLDTLTKEAFEFVVGLWPLVSESATPVCGATNPNSLGVEVDGVAYALNGTAETWEHWRDLHDIWAPNPGIPGAYLNQGDLLDFVRRHCAD